MNIRNNSGPRTLPCGTPEMTGSSIIVVHVVKHQSVLINTMKSTKVQTLGTI